MTDPVSFGRNKPCTVCTCRDCWQRKGFNADRCAACVHSVCAEDSQYGICAEWLVGAISAGEVAVVGARL